MTVHSERRCKRRAALAVAVPLALVVAGCNGGGYDDDDETSTGADPSGSHDLSVEITAPEAGATVSEPFDVEVDSSVDVGEIDAGEHHLHLYYDGNTDQDSYDIVTSDSFTVDRDLGEGEHSIKAVIANADHSLTEAEDEITVNIGAGDSGGGEGDDDGGYDIGY